MSAKPLAAGVGKSLWVGGDAWLIAAALALVGSALFQFTGHMNWDVSWLIEVGERTLDGAVPYADFQEVNPPASILIYIPPIQLARLLGLRPETATTALVVLAAIASLSLSALILEEGGIVERNREQCLGFGAVLVLLVLPLYSFAQREHIVLLASLPILSTISVRLGGRIPVRWTALAAGLGAGVALSIKPMFVLAFVGPVLLLVRRRTLRAACRSEELWLAASIAALYASAVLALFPLYAERILPLALAVYFPARLPWYELLSLPRFWVWLLLLYTFLRLSRRSGASVLGTVLMLASAGFEAVFLLMGKGFSYQAYPGLALAILACVAALPSRLDRSIGKGHPRWDVVAIVAAILIGLSTFGHRYDPALAAPGLVEAIKAISPHPRVMAITGNISLGHPFVREIGGTWVGSSPFPWITYNARLMADEPEKDSRFEGFIQSEQDAFASDIERAGPDALLIDGPAWLAWMGGTPALAHAFGRFDQKGTFGTVMLWIRKPNG